MLEIQVLAQVHLEQKLGHIKQQGKLRLPPTSATDLEGKKADFKVHVHLEA